MEILNQILNEHKKTVALAGRKREKILLLKKVAFQHHNPSFQTLTTECIRQHIRSQKNMVAFLTNVLLTN